MEIEKYGVTAPGPIFSQIENMIERVKKENPDLPDVPDDVKAAYARARQDKGTMSDQVLFRAVLGGECLGVEGDKDLSVENPWVSAVVNFYNNIFES